VNAPRHSSHRRPWLVALAILFFTMIVVPLVARFY